MISSVVTDDSCYKLTIVHKRDNEYPTHQHIMYSDTFKEMAEYLMAVYHVFRMIELVRIEMYEE